MDPLRYKIKIDARRKLFKCTAANNIYTFQYAKKIKISFVEMKIIK